MACPFMDLADPRCADHFSINRLADAFTHCLGQSRACSIYHRLMRERPTETDLSGSVRAEPAAEAVLV